MSGSSWTFLATVIILASKTDAEVRAKVFITPEQCGSTHYFDALSLSCESCSIISQINFASSPNQSDILESLSPDKTACVCRNGSMLVMKNDNYYIILITYNQFVCLHLCADFI